LNVFIFSRKRVTFEVRDKLLILHANEFVFHLVSFADFVMRFGFGRV
jgi:hypothetical protein